VPGDQISDVVQAVFEPVVTPKPVIEAAKIEKSEIDKTRTGRE
jgi:hypothetical protein